LIAGDADTDTLVVNSAATINLSIVDCHGVEKGSVTFEGITFAEAPDLGALKVLVDIDDGTTP